LAKIKTKDRTVEGITVSQQETDGYIHATALAQAYEKATGTRKDARDWLLTERAKAYIERLSAKTGIPVLELIKVKKGGDKSGTWIHPKLSVPFATWLSIEFEMMVSEWVDEWLTSYSPTQLEADLDRVLVRDELKNKKRLELTKQIKAFLESAGRYQPGSFSTKQAFWKAHDKLNIVITGETASEMLDRLKNELGREVNEKELIRDYFPILDLTDYAALSQAAANEMALNGTDPILAIDIAAKYVLSPSRVRKPIDFTERISLVRERISQRGQLPLIA
jgi:hypothetical protein